MLPNEHRELIGSTDSYTGRNTQPSARNPLVLAADDV